jgi:hypothetical protein
MSSSSNLGRRVSDRRVSSSRVAYGKRVSLPAAATVLPYRSQMPVPVWRSCATGRRNQSAGS